MIKAECGVDCGAVEVAAGRRRRTDAEATYFVGQKGAATKERSSVSKCGPHAVPAATIFSTAINRRGHRVQLPIPSLGWSTLQD
jgi:hypothetical protein